MQSMKGFIGENTTIKNVYGDESTKIYSNCRVFDSVLGSNASIGDFGTVRDSQIGERSSIQRYSDIWGLRLGRYSCIGRISTIQETKIGSFCALADYMTIGCDDHDYKMLSIHPFWHDVSWGISEDKDFSIKYRKHEFSDPCEIGNDVWIGAGVNICRNVKIGNGCVIGAGAVITKSIPAYSVVVGVPGRIIKSRFSDETIECLEKCNWWNLPISIIKEKLFLFRSGHLNEKLLGELQELCQSYGVYREL